MNTISRADVVLEARKWIGTRYHHQASLIGVGCDCRGLVCGVADALGVDVSRVPKNYSPEPAQGLLQATLESYLELTHNPKIGDIILFRIRSQPQHIGIMSENDYFIHAYQSAGKVVEHRLCDKWGLRIVAFYKFKGITD